MPIYLKIDGVRGNATTSNYEDQIPVDTVEFSVHSDFSLGVHQRRDALKASKIKITKRVDNNFNDFIKHLSQGEQTNMDLRFTIADSSKGDGSEITYMHYKLERCFITDVYLTTEKDVPPITTILVRYEKNTCTISNIALTGMPESPTKVMYGIPSGDDV